MNSRLPMATISYNSVDFLFTKLEELRKAHIISFWAFICHFKEEDEEKDHIHLLVKPNRTLDSMSLQEALEEPDFNHPDLPPLGCMDFWASKCDNGNPDDWILYCSHYPPYLATKMESRVYAYDKGDFYCSDYNTFREMFRHAFKGSKWAKDNKILQLLAEGDINPCTLIETGAIPLGMSCSINAYDYMRKNWGHTTRGEHSNHE